MFRVPAALTPKSVCGSDAAQSCEGCAAAWTTTAIRPRFSPNTRRTASPSRMSTSSELNSGKALVNRSVTGRVDASGPKKAARMSFSIPITRCPVATKCSTVSDPTRPPDPVTIATSTPLSNQRGANRALVLRNPGERVREDPARVAARAPVGHAEQARAVREVDPHVARALLGRGLDRHPVAGQLPAELGRLDQRQARGAATADVDRRARPVVGTEELVLDEVDQVVHVEEVAHLLAGTAVSDVAELAPEVVAEQPVGEDPLVDPAHLPGAGDHAAAVDHRRQAECRRELGDEQLRRQLGGSVERARALEREDFAYPRLRGPRQRSIGGQLVAG